MENDFIFYDDNRKLQQHKGYAFIDEWGHCIIIVCGERRRDLMSQYLLENTFIVQGIE